MGAAAVGTRDGRQSVRRNSSRLALLVALALVALWSAGVATAHAGAVSGHVTGTVLTTTPQGHLSGTVVDNNGQPISGVMVECCAINGKDWGGGPDTYTAADGTYSLTVAPGTYGLVFDMYGYDRVYYQQAHNPDDATLVQVTDGASLTGLDAMLTLQAVVINCWAFDVDDLPLAGIDVDVLNIHDQSVIASAVTGADGSATVDLGNVTDQTFKVRYTDPSGVYAIRFSGHSDTFAAAQGVYATHGCAGLSIEYLAYPQPGEIRGRTLDLDGNPVPNIYVEARNTASQPFADYETTSDANGNYSLPNLRVAGSTSFQMEFWKGGNFADSYWTETTDWDHRVFVQAGQSVTYNSSLDPVCSINGTITVAGSGPLDGGTVECFTPDGTDFCYGPVDAKGHYVISDLHADTYFLECSSGPAFGDVWYHDATTFASATPVTVGCAQRTFTADQTLTHTGTIAGNVSSALSPYAYLPNMTVTLYDSGGNQLQTATTNVGGLFEFSDLPLGTYYIAANDPSGEYLPVWYEGASDLADATPATLTSSSWMKSYLVCMSPKYGVDPNPGAEPDGSLTTPTTVLGIKASATCQSQGSLLVVGEGVEAETGCYFFQMGPAGWAEKTVLAPPVDSDGFGHAAAMDGDTAVVSDFVDDTAHDTAGKVYVYQRTAGVWQRRTTLVPRYTPDDDSPPPSPDPSFYGFGASVAISGDTILVGAPYAYENGVAATGAVYAFRLVGNSWTRQRVVSKKPTQDDWFGCAVALEGDSGFVGASNQDTSVCADAGAVDILTRGDFAWTQTGRLTAGDGAAGAGFGQALAVCGDKLAVSAPDQDWGAGSAYVFRQSGSDWEQQVELSAADGQPEDGFGRTLSLDGNTLLVGAPDAGSLQQGQQSGAAYLYDWRGAQWFPDAEFASPATDTSLSLGDTLTVAGRDLFIGVPGEDRGYGGAGTVRVYSPYTTEQGQPLTVDAARGVLTNDRGPDAAPLTMQLVTNPAHGALDASADGSFEYDPEAGFVGTDTFTYRAISGSWQSDPAIVTITVRDTSAPTIDVHAPQVWVNTPAEVVLSAQDDTTVDALQYRSATPGGEASRASLLATPAQGGSSAPGSWATYTSPFTVSAQGCSVYDVRSRDVFGNAAYDRFTVKVDTIKPEPQAPYAARVSRGHYCRLTYMIADARPGSPTASVTIAVRDVHDNLRWKRKFRRQWVNRWLTCEFMCRLPAGSYQFFVAATDAAGNRQTELASNRLTVRPAKVK